VRNQIRAAATAILIAFVAVSVGYLVWEGTREPGPAPPDTAVSGVVPPAGGSDRTTVVYYFHGHTRCWTCRTIEAFTREAVESAFGPELETGEVEMRVVNVEEPGNGHFVEDYQLATRSVVLVDVVGGRERRWQRLDEVWNLVNDKASFMEYIIGNAREFRKGTG